MKRKEKRYYIYIIASKINGTLYIGVTGYLLVRSFQHRLKEKKDSFSAKYDVNRLVYYEVYKYVNDAILREKQLKKWERKWKINLIEKDNSVWRDLFDNMI